MEEGRRARRRRVAVALLVASAGCRGSTPPQLPPLAKALAAALGAADHVRTPWRCAALDAPALPAATIKGWQVAGNTMTLGAAGPVVIGVVADAGGAAPETIAALARLRGQLDAASPALVVTLGGMGATEAELTATLGTLADRATYPVVVLPGDLESESAQVAALTALAARGDAVLDGRLVRWIEAGSATLATIPGAGAPGRLVAGGDGCAWQADDVAQVATRLASRPGLRVAVTAEGPRAVVDGEPTGELALALHDVDVAVHGAAGLTGACAGRRDGLATSVSPGTADAAARLPQRHAPSAGVLTIRNLSWTWSPLVDTK